MALGDAYCTNTTLKAYLGIPSSDTADDTLLTSACVAASAWVNNACQRDFNKTTTASARVYRADNSCAVDVDDFHTITDLVVKLDTGADGLYGTTTTSYTLEPSGGYVGGVTGIPYRRVRFVRGVTIPFSEYPQVQVTAQWGWNAIPEPVTLASKIVAAYLFNLKDSPFGIASFGDNGLIRLRTDVPQAAMLLQNYERPGRTGAFLA
jgi:hypothetical protein